jgi:hypothetical protein
MSALIRTVALALVVGLLTLGVFGLRFACSPSDWQALLRESRRLENLRQWQRVTLHREECQRQAVHEWIAGRYSLAEILRRFQELDRESVQQWPAYRTLVQKKSRAADEERLYQTIRTRIETILHGRPKETALVLRRLEKDYQQLQGDRQKTSATRSDGRERNR